VQGSSNNSIILGGVDAETTAANLTYTIVTTPLHGTLSTTLDPRERLYTATPGFSGTDTFTFTVTDRGSPDNCGAPGPGCSPPLTSAPAMVTIQVTPSGGTTSTALSITAVSAPSEGVAIGNIQIDENATGALAAGSQIKLGLPQGVTFSTMPNVSFSLSNGAALNGAPSLESPSVLSFTLAAPSTMGPASILVSGVLVNISSDVLAGGLTSAAVLTTV